MRSRFTMLCLLLLFTLPAFGSLVDEITARPGEMVEVPPGRHEIDAPLHFTADGGGLYGAGTIVQRNAAQPIVRVENARGVRIEGVTLTRPAEVQETSEPALRADGASDLTVRGVRILDNHSQSGAITLRDCARVTVSDCDVLNYKVIGVDDRTTSPLYGYAFRCIDGAGISVSDSVHVSISNNRVIEERLVPTREMKDAHQLGNLIDGKQPLNPGELARGVAERGYVDNWHQGSAIVVTGPTRSRHIQIQGNLVVNAAQAIDMHCDYANVSGNVIDRCMIGIKGTHGCYGLVVTGNTITGADLWGMVFNPGAASHDMTPAEEGGPAREWNGDAGLVIANNVIADYGHGNEYWNWGGREADAPSSYAIALLSGQLKTNPPYRDILITGNAVLAGGRDKEPAQPARYRYAVYLEGWDAGTRENSTAAEGVGFHGNILHAGLRGVCNATMEE